MVVVHGGFQGNHCGLARRWALSALVSSLVADHVEGTRVIYYWYLTNPSPFSQPYSEVVEYQMKELTIAMYQTMICIKCLRVFPSPDYSKKCHKQHNTEQ
eukprot:12392075-Ditylum_brightwellii.AAC.1